MAVILISSGCDTCAPEKPDRVLHYEPATTETDFFPRQAAESAGLSRKAVDALVWEAEQKDTHALILIVRGRTVVERYFGHKPGPIPTKSVTKSVVSLAIGMLLNDGRIESLDTPLSTWFSDWSAGAKAKVTLRHLLTHRSGLRHRSGTAFMEKHDDQFAFARESPIVEEPGAVFSYNNEATQLLAGVVKSASGVPVDKLLGERLFQPLGIKTWSWEHDRAGNVLTYGGLTLTARDLALTGVLMLNEGRQDSTQIVPAKWVKVVAKPSSKSDPHYGLLWWIRLRRAKDGGGPKTAVAAMANGWLGQHLLVYPKQGIVAVRLRRQTGFGGDSENKKYGWLQFPKFVEAATAR